MQHSKMQLRVRLEGEVRTRKKEKMKVIKTQKIGKKDNNNNKTKIKKGHRAT